ncbi:putative integrase domain protein [Escherichia coli DEC2A]|nr:putative integrase domain protein [Escherichia coli DEC2A]EHX12806.1 putative integrase domain protein [Escherichia coli DEC11D]
MRKIDESPSATKRRGIRLKAWVDRYLKIQDTRLKNGDIAATTHKEKPEWLHTWFPVWETTH